MYLTSLLRYNIYTITNISTKNNKYQPSLVGFQLSIYYSELLLNFLHLHLGSKSMQNKLNKQFQFHSVLFLKGFMADKALLCSCILCFLIKI